MKRAFAIATITLLCGAAAWFVYDASSGVGGPQGHDASPSAAPANGADPSGAPSPQARAAGATVTVSAPSDETAAGGGEDAERRLLADRAAGLDAAAAVAMVSGFDGSDDETGPFLWRATGLVRLDPTAADALGAAAVAEDTPPAGRELALDVLAHAGTPPAQRALTRALSSPTLAADPPHRRLLLQRLSFVDRPDDETVAWAESLWDDAEGPERRAAASILGAVAGHRAAAGDAATADRLAARLRDALATADDDDRPALLQGLGNAARPADQSLLVTASAAAAVRDRAAAASALRHYETAAAQDAMVALVSDRSASVQRRALSALDGRTLTPAQLDALTEAVRADAVSRVSDAALVNVVARQSRDPQCQALLRAVLSRADDDPRMRARVRSLLQP